MYKLGRTWPKLGWVLGRELRPKMDYAEVYTLLSPWPHLHFLSTLRLLYSNLRLLSNVLRHPIPLPRWLKII